MNIRFHNRQAAGKQIASALSAYANQPNTLVLAIPRGGVPVAYEVAQALQLPLDICLVRKLGVLDYPEVAMGAIGLGGVRILNDDVIKLRQIPTALIEQVTQRELQELNRRDRTYRGDRPAPDVTGRQIILIDDGIATGATMRAAITVIQAQQPEAIVVAVPMAPATTCQSLERQVDRVICLSTPSPFLAIGLWYDSFPQTTDEQVNQLLKMTITDTDNKGLAKRDVVKKEPVKKDPVKKTSFKKTSF